MKRIRRYFLSALTLLSLALCVGVCTLWLRGRSGCDQALWSYDRWLADRSVASNYVQLRSDARLWLTIGGGHVGPYNGQLVWGYYLNADQSGGHPRLTFQHDKYDPLTKYLMSTGSVDPVPGVGPLRFGRWTRTAARDGDDSMSVCVGVSHWLAVAVLGVLPARATWGMLRRRRRRRREGYCTMCGYDLRATPQRCPECGLVPAKANA